MLGRPWTVYLADAICDDGGTIRFFQLLAIHPWGTHHHVSGIVFFKIWEFAQKVLGSPSLFTTPIVIGGKTPKVNIDEMYRLWPRNTADPGLLLTISGQDVGSFVNKICLLITTVHWHMSSRCRPDSDACRRHVEKSESVPIPRARGAMRAGCPR